jgi:beta-phosphoglucomutase
MIKGGVFDFDGVIADSHPAHVRAWRMFLGSVGKTVSDEQLQFVLDGRRREDILRHFLGELAEDQLLDYGQRKERMFRDEASWVRPTNGLPEFLESLESSGLALAIASSGSRSRIDFLLDRFGLQSHFRAVVTGDDVKLGKPHPAVYLRAAHQLEIDPADLIAFEDAVCGVLAARSAGMNCIGIAPQGGAARLLDAGASHVVPDFHSLSRSMLLEFSSNGAGASYFRAVH